MEDIAVWVKSLLATRVVSGGGWRVKIGERLCLACGMCCDGTLFEKVELAPSEDAKKLKKSGLPVQRSRAKEPVMFFRQPCKALCEDCTCRVYTDRPKQCRAFECGVYKSVTNEVISLEEGLRLVKRARRMANKVKRLLRALGDEDESRSLDDRLRRTHRRLEREGVDTKKGDIFADLGLAMHRLGLLAHDRFYTEEE